MVHSFGKTLAHSDASLSGGEKEVQKTTMSTPRLELDASEIPSTSSIMRVLKKWTEKTITAKRYGRESGQRIVAYESAPIPQPVAENSDRVWFYLHREFIMGKPLEATPKPSSQNVEDEQGNVSMSEDEGEFLFSFFFFYSLCYRKRRR